MDFGAEKASLFPAVSLLWGSFSPLDHGDNQTFQRGCSNEKQSTWHSACCVGVQINVIAKLMIMTMTVETEGVRRHHIPSAQTHYEICVWHWVLG